MSQPDPKAQQEQDQMKQLQMRQLQGEVQKLESEVQKIMAEVPLLGAKTQKEQVMAGAEHDKVQNQFAQTALQHSGMVLKSQELAIERQRLPHGRVAAPQP